ncbi:MAG: hypothetical protein AB8G26_18550 [Ilumatobacter sp.]
MSDQATEPEPSAVDAATDDTGPEASASSTELDLDAVESDLDAVQVALARLAEGTYWTDEVTSDPIADSVLAADPLARRA